MKKVAGFTKASKSPSSRSPSPQSSPSNKGGKAFAFPTMDTEVSPGKSTSPTGSMDTTEQVAANVRKDIVGAAHVPTAALPPQLPHLTLAWP